MPNVLGHISMLKNIFFIFCLVTTTNIAFGQKDTIAKFSELSIDSMGKIKWTMTYMGAGPSYSVSAEQFKNNKWVFVGGIGGGFKIVIRKPGPIPTQTNTPTKQIRKDSCIVKFHKGTNIYRLKMIKPVGGLSSEFQLISKVSNDDGSLWVSGNKIFLDYTENYEILNSSGDPVLKGEDKTIDISSLPHGSYFFYTKKETRPFVK